MSQLRKRRVRTTGLALWVSIGLMALLAACVGTTAPVPEDATADTGAAEIAAAPAAENTARIVVQLDDSRMRARAVAFSEPISGLAALAHSGLPVVTADFSWGTGVCSIAAVGCPADDCFCGGDTFWNYGYLAGDTWESYATGAAQSVISETGAVEGWRWGAGDVTFPDPDRVDAVYAALDYIRAQQVAGDGSYAENMGGSIETLLALSANQQDAGAWRATPTAPSLLDYVTANAAGFSQEGASAAGKLAVGLTGAGACWPAGALTPSDYYSETLGAPAADAGPLAWAILGMAALEQPLPDETVAYLKELMLEEGGWEWGQGFGRDTNTTSLALQALAAAGVAADDPVITAAFDYLRTAQTETGGFGYDPSVGRGEADANSTAYVVQALVAWGLDPTGPDWQQPGGSPLDFLISLQAADGSLSWQASQGTANLVATQQAVPALLGQPYPVQRRSLPACGE